MRKFALFCSCLGLLLPACSPTLEVEPTSSGPLNLENTVFIGGHYFAGYRHGALFDDAQNTSVASLMLKQFDLTHAPSIEGNFIPLIGGEGLGINLKPWESEFQSPSLLRYRTDCEGVTSLGPVKTLFSSSSAGTMLNPIGAIAQRGGNYAVPFARLQDLSNPAFGLAWPAGNPYYHRFASAPGTSTLLGDIVQKNPSFFVLSTGMEDVFEYASSGGTVDNLPSPAAFQASLDSILVLLELNGAKGLISNLPSIELFPYFTTIKWNGLELSQVKADSLNDVLVFSGFNPGYQEGSNGFLVEDSNAVGNYRQMVEGELITLGMPVDSLKCYYVGIAVGPVPDKYCLDSGEVSYLKSRIEGYNAAISALANAHGLALTDLNSYLEKVKDGIRSDGVDFNSGFVSGGFYSLDGYTPTAKGAGLIANEFIRTMNQFYGSNIYSLEIHELEGILFP